MKKRIIIISIFLVILLIPIVILLNNNKIGNLKEGTFQYASSLDNVSRKEKYYYTDDYFIKLSGTEKNNHLRTMAMNITLATTPSVDKNKSTENINNLLNNIGFKNVKSYDYEIKKPDSVGTNIAHKPINNFETLIVSIQGDKYNIEWESNFVAGSKGNIKGFEDGSRKVISRIKEYIKENRINKEIKILVTGYSRGGAIANLVGVYLNEHKEEFNIKSEKNIYIYTFEAPNSSSNNKIYKNIHNVVNKNDLITYVYPSSWNIHNNGVIEEIGNDKSYIDIYSLNIFNKNNMLIKDKKIKINEFLDDFITWLSDDDILNREFYTKTVEKYIPKLIDIIYYKKIESGNLSKFLSEIFNEIMKNQSVILPHLFDGSLNEVINENINKWIDNAKRNSEYLVLPNEQYTFIKEMLTDKNNIDLITKLIFKSLREEPSAYHLSTFISNLDIIFKQHYTQVNYDLIKKEDSFY